MRDVACPIVRQDGRILAFRHPLAGPQLGKGGIEPGETPEAAATRELAEEAGVLGVACARVGVVVLKDRWHLVDMRVPSLPNSWVHHCKDDGGHEFAFFWAAGLDGFAPPYTTILERVL